MKSIRVVFHAEDLESGEVIVEKSQCVMKIDDYLLMAGAQADGSIAQAIEIGKRREMFKAIGIAIERFLSAKLLPLPIDKAA